MSHSIMRFVEAERCEELIRSVESFIAAAYTEANAIARRAHIYEYGMDMEAFAFPIHCPGSPETDHLPGFRPAELPEDLAQLCRDAARALRLEKGRMLFNVGRYPEQSIAVPAHYDGELFDFTVEPNVGNHVRSGIRPSEVALLTLRNETERCGTTLHDEEGKVISTVARAGELLVFDNVHYQHGVAETGANVVRPPGGSEGTPRWARYTIGWRALEEGFFWCDERPLRPLRFAEAVELHDDYLAGEWATQLAEDLARARFPFPTRHV